MDAGAICGVHRAFEIRYVDSFARFLLAQDPVPIRQPQPFVIGIGGVNRRQLVRSPRQAQVTAFVIVRIDLLFRTNAADFVH